MKNEMKRRAVKCSLISLVSLLLLLLLLVLFSVLVKQSEDLILWGALTLVLLGSTLTFGSSAKHYYREMKTLQNREKLQKFYEERIRASFLE